MTFSMTYQSVSLSDLVSTVRYHAVEAMRNGASPEEAAQSAADRMAMYFPENNAAVIVANTAGEIGS